MRSFGCPALLAGVFLMSAMAGVAHAQMARSQPSPEESVWYAQALVEATFGNLSSQSYGLEAGVTVRPDLQVFVEGGRVNNVASSAFATAAQLIAGSLGQTQSQVGYSAKEPVVFGDAGVRYLVPVSGTSLQPYVLGGFGIARVKQDATFSVGGSDVTGNLAQYGIVLGTDLSSTFTNPLLVLGAGLTVPVWQHLAVDVHYRYGRIFAGDAGFNVSRAGIGFGVRF
ncbi:MAG TPA: outer membrane beta-barrel protein [Vicinamibacterales bacterium]|nr:outer membrane beta-barrel protein [Vicinamibacterales bacterium]